MNNLNEILFKCEISICKFKPSEGKKLYEKLSLLHTMAAFYKPAQTIAPFIKKLMADMEDTLVKNQTEEKFQEYKSRAIKLANATVTILIN